MAADLQAFRRPFQYRTFPIIRRHGMIESARCEFTYIVTMTLPRVSHASVVASSSLSSFKIDFRLKLIPALVCPSHTRWPPFSRRRF